jgi:hypothetical protein
MDTFLEEYNQPKLNQEDINHMTKSITSNEIEAVIKSLPTKKSPDLKDSLKFYHLKKKRTNTNISQTFSGNRKGRTTTKLIE